MKLLPVLLMAAFFGAVPALAGTDSPVTPLQAEPPAAAKSPVPAPVPTGPFPKSGFVAYTFGQLGAPQGLRLIEGDAQGGVTYMVRRDQVITHARLHLILANSAGFPAKTRLEVTVNGDAIGAVDVGTAAHAPTPVDLPIDPILLSDYNRIGFKLSKVALASCQADKKGRWLTIGAMSAVDVTADRLPLANDLAILPLPFFDNRDPHQVKASFVFARPPGATTLEAAGIVASWLGSLAGYRGVHFPAVFGAVPTGNAIVFATVGDYLPGLKLPQAVGPTLALIANPIDPNAKLLLVMGGKPGDLKAAAAALALGRRDIKGGAVSAVLPPPAPPRAPDDAPDWLPDSHPVKLGSIVPSHRLISHGLRPEPIDIDFHSAPDYFNWVGNEIPMTIRFGVNSQRAVKLEASRLDVSLNGTPFESVPLAHSGTLFSGPRPVHQASVRIPSFLLTGRNRLRFYFDMKPSNHCVPAVVSSITEHIDPNSTINLSKSPHYAPMPNLSFFANTGFPFTREADLSGSAVVMPKDANEPDVEAYLETIALFGESTGYPTLRLTVVPTGAVERVASRNLLLIGAYPRQPLLAAWTSQTRITMDHGNLRILPRNWWERVEAVFDWRNRGNGSALVNRWLDGNRGGEGALIGFRSPLDAQRSVVAISGTDPAHMLLVSRLLQSSPELTHVQGDLVVARRHEEIASFRIARRYDVGSLARWTWLRWNLSDQPIIIVILLFAACAALSAVAFVILGIKARRRLQGANR
ncbi:MAG: cellulose biosynthesis cyclic di-GMP-binding regulatory protein BcsB [Stellaceae bacterium]